MILRAVARALAKTITSRKDGVFSKVLAAHQALLTASSEEERLKASIHLAALEAAQANRALGGRLTSFVQMLWAMPFILYNWKLVVWDKIFAGGATDPLSQSLMDLQLRVATFYFGGAIAIGVVNAVRRA